MYKLRISYIKDIYSLIIQDTPSQLKVKGMRHLTKLKIIGSVISKFLEL